MQTLPPEVSWLRIRAIPFRPPPATLYAPPTMCSRASPLNGGLSPLPNGPASTGRGPKKGFTLDLLQGVLSVRSQAYEIGPRRKRIGSASTRFDSMSAAPFCRDPLGQRSLRCSKMAKTTLNAGFYPPCTWPGIQPGEIKASEFCEDSLSALRAGASAAEKSSWMCGKKQGLEARRGGDKE